MAEFDPQGFGERLAAEMERTGLDIKAFQTRLRDATGARGTSYSSVWGYVNGHAPHDGPRREVIEAAAEILGVLPDWLAHREGPRTEQERPAWDAAQQALAEEEAEGAREGWRENFRILEREFGEGAERLAEDAVTAWIIIVTANRLIRHSPRGLDDWWAEHVEPESVEHRTYRAIGRVLRTPFSYASLEPRKLNDDELTDYVSLMCHGLRRLAEAQDRMARTAPRLLPEPEPRTTEEE